jgi:hypothetical protein
VVQFGLAMSFDFLVHSPLISGTTNGISGSYRKADYLFQHRCDVVCASTF